MTIYDDILANISVDKKAWCQEEWTTTDDSGKPVSRCLVEHVDLALGTTYVKPNGKIFVSKDPKKWSRRSRVLAHLASLLPEGFRRDGDYEEVEFTKDDLALLAPDENSRRYLMHDGLGYYDDAQDDLVGFNDTSSTKKADVRKLLKKAVKAFPED